MPNYPYYPTYPTQMNVNPTQMNVNPTQMSVGTIQNGGFVSVRNEEEAIRYPIAPGNSITFKDETAPYVYTKTMGFSQLDRPVFEKYKLVKEKVNDSQELVKDLVKDYQSDIDKLWNEIDEIKANIKAMERPTTRKTKSGGDD